MKGVPFRDYTDSISLITKMLIDKELPIKKRTLQKKILQKILKSFESPELTGKSLFSDPIKPRFPNPKKKIKIETPLITLFKNSSEEMKSIINYLDVQNPLYFLQFAKNPKNTRFYSDCLDSIILLIWYNILLTPFLKENSAIFEDLLSNAKTSDLCEWVLRVDVRKLIFSGEREKFEDFNKNLLELGKIKILERINSGHNYKEKFKIIKAVIFKKTLFLTNYEKFSNLSFVRLCIEAAVLSFNIYNKSILIQKEPDKDLKLKSIIINKILKFKNSFPLLVFVTQEKIEFYLSVLKNEEVSNNVDFLGIENEEEEEEQMDYGNDFIDFTKLEEDFENKVTNFENKDNYEIKEDFENMEKHFENKKSEFDIKKKNFENKEKNYEKNKYRNSDKKKVKENKNENNEIKNVYEKKYDQEYENNKFNKNLLENNFENENILEFEKFDKLNLEKFNFDNKTMNNNLDNKKENINFDNEIIEIKKDNNNLLPIDKKKNYHKIFEKNIKNEQDQFEKTKTFDKLTKKPKRKKNFSLEKNKNELRPKQKNNHFNILDLKIENPEKDRKKKRPTKKYSIKNFSRDLDYNNQNLLKRVNSIRSKTPEIKEDKNKILTYDLSNSRNQKNLDKKAVLTKQTSISDYTYSFERFKEKNKIKKDKNILLKQNETIIIKNGNNKNEKKQGIFSYKREDKKKNFKDSNPLVPSLEYTLKPNISKLIKKSSKLLKKDNKVENIIVQDLDETTQYDNICQNLTNLNYLTKIIENSKDISININHNKSPKLENIKKKDFFKNNTIFFSKLSNILDLNKLNSQNLFLCLKKKKKNSNYENYNYYRNHSLNPNNHYYNKKYPYSKSPLLYNYKEDSQKNIAHKSKTISYRNKLGYIESNFEGGVRGIGEFDSRVNRKPPFKKK